MSQQALYSQTAAPMLKSFLEGFNVTIMAYGQTGSGKTFTMGTSDLGSVERLDQQGLTPRFMADLFDNLASSSSSSSDDKVEWKVRVSFLEIYGEDVYDLIGHSGNSGNGIISNNNATSAVSSANNANSTSTTAISSSKASTDRPSLPVREDEAGHVFVQGQQEIEVGSAAEALEILSIGTRNRITGSTAMNSGSSRSHAVFTVSLEQSVKSCQSDVLDDTHLMASKLTFVDLAGSERIKRTGAEGQRLKEGIQINSGLFNLGQVINALADEQRIKQGKAIHVPYRNSKLTHLLKDALGGTLKPFSSPAFRLPSATKAKPTRR